MPRLSYGSQTNLNRMTGNWWFPLDVFVVPQANGDLWYYAPGIVGAVYTWNTGAGTYTSPPGAFDLMSGNPNGPWTRTTKRGTQWHFNQSGYVDYILNRYGLQTTITRNPANQIQILAWTDYAGRSTTVNYYPSGYASSIVDWGGRTVSFTYTSQGYLASIVYPATTFYDTATQSIVTRPKVLSFTYISGTGTQNDGNLVTVFDDATRTALSNTYDGLDRALSTTQRGRLWSYQYLANGQTRVIDPDGVTIDYAYDSQGATIRKTVWTKSGLGNTPLRQGEPNQYVWTYERNAGCSCSLVTRILAPDGTDLRFTYDSWGNLLSRRRTDSTTSTSHLETWTWSSFSQFCMPLTYTYPMGNEPGATAADYTITRTYDAWGSLIGVFYPLAVVNGAPCHPTFSYTRGPFGEALAFVSTAGVTTQYAYDPVTILLVQVVEDAGGLQRTTGFTYDQYDRTVAVTNARGFASTFTYNDLDQLVCAAGPQPKAPSKELVYDENNKVHSITVENKGPGGTPNPSNPAFTLTFAYNTFNQLTSSTREIDGSTSATTSFTYTAAGRLASLTDPNGITEVVTYDERGLEYQTTQASGTPDAATTTYGYDLNGRISSIQSPGGVTRYFSFDSFDRLCTSTWPNGAFIEADWDANGRQTALRLKDPTSVLRTSELYSYDPIGQVLTSTRHLLDAQGAIVRGVTTAHVYDAGLRLVQTTPPVGTAVTQQYDGLDRVTTVGMGQDTVALTYDLNHNVTCVTRSEYNAVTTGQDVVVEEVSYDELDRRTSALRRDSASTVVQSEAYAYDGLGRLVAHVDPLGNTRSWTWDARGLCTSTSRDLRAGGTGAGAVTSTIQTTAQYDLGGRLVGRVDGMGRATTTTYDARNRVVTAASAAGARAYTYDAHDNLITCTDAVGAVVTNTYDILDNLVSRSVSRGTGVMGTTSETYAYDGVGRLISASDDDSSASWTPDSLGRETSEALNGNTFTYGYDDNGACTSVVYPDGTVETRTLDTQSRLTSVSIPGQTLATYQSAGTRVVGLALPNNVSRSSTFDALLRPTLLTYTRGTTQLRKFEYAWTLANQRALEKRHHAGGTGDNYGLDSLYRMTQVKVGVADPALEYANPGSQTVTSTVNLTYDAAGSRTQVLVTGAGAGTTAYTSDNLGFYTSVGGVTHVRDANGNLRDDGTLLYSYDYRNQLVEVRQKSNSVLVAHYEYDVLGRRTQKQIGGGTTTFGWIGMELATESDVSGLISRRHLGAADNEVVAAYLRDFADLNGNGSTTDYVWLYPLYDGAYDCVGVLGPAGTLAESYVHGYDGTVAITNGAGTPLTVSAVGWQQGYARYYRDDETGLLYAVRRYYSPPLGRFLTEDPIGRWADAPNLGNGYTFVGNRYRNAYDPLGLEAEKCPCGEKYVIATVTRWTAMWPGKSWGREYAKYEANITTVLDALKDRYDGKATADGSRPPSSGRIHLHEDWGAASYVDGDTEHKRRVKAYEDDLKNAKDKDDPCLDGYTHIGHGEHKDGFAWLKVFGAYKSAYTTLGPAPGPNGHKLSFIGILCCHGGGSASGSQWSNYVANPNTDVVTSYDRTIYGSEAHHKMTAERIANMVRNSSR